MKRKKYVVVTNPLRECLERNWHMGKASKSSYRYRNGELGLLHPAVIEFYSNKENMDKTRTFIPTSGFQIELYFPKEGDSQILMYGGAGRGISKKDEYFIIPLLGNEFESIEGTDLVSVKKGIKDVRKKNGMSPAIYEPSLENEWRHLEAFDILIPQHKINEIPFEVTQRYISEKTLESESKLLKGLRDCSQSSIPEKYWKMPIR